MLKDITLGQYFPGNSVIHLLDPRTKLLMLIVYIAALFTASNWISYGVIFFVSCADHCHFPYPVKIDPPGNEALGDDPGVYRYFESVFHRR